MKEELPVKNDTLLVALAFVIVILCLLVCVAALWQPANPALPTFSPSTSAPTVEQTQASIPPVPESTEPVSTIPSTTAPAETTTATVHEHTYTGKVTKAPTCTASGVRTYTCECGASYQENIEPLAHAYVIAVRNPTCTQNGCTTYTCKNCGYSEMELGESALGHSFGPWTVKKAPTETTTGIAEHQCTRCQETETVTLPKLG